MKARTLSVAAVAAAIAVITNVNVARDAVAAPSASSAAPVVGASVLGAVATSLVPSGCDTYMAAIGAGGARAFGHTYRGPAAGEFTAYGMQCGATAGRAQGYTIFVNYPGANAGVVCLTDGTYKVQRLRSAAAQLVTVTTVTTESCQTTESSVVYYPARGDVRVTVTYLISGSQIVQGALTVV